jgi:signal transduction histidine kinase
MSYFLIFACAGLLLTGAAWAMARHSLLFELDHEMDEHIDDIHDFMAANGLMGDETRAGAAIEEDFARKDEGKWLQIVDGRGNWVYRSGHMLFAPHGVPAARSLPRRGNFLNFTAHGEPVRSLRRAFTLDGRTWVVESGESLDKTDRVLVHFRDELLLISPIILLIAGIAGHMLSRRALDPVAAIANEAQRIHEGNLQNRLPQLETRDELAYLSTTLNDMLERIESGVRSVRDFTAHASHELRTPVALIRSEADLALRCDRPSGEYRSALQTIGAEARQMSSLLDSLLFLARVDAGTEEASLEPVDAQSVFTEAVRKWMSIFRRAGIRFSAELPPEPVMVLADRTYLPRLLNIVLENAGKYTPAGGSVRLSLTADGEQCRFAVSDTGIGISAEDLPHIFGRFYRAARVRATSSPGSGLGLALAAWIAARHQTTIDVDSTLDAGSTFAWTLALAQRNARIQTDRGTGSALFLERESICSE